jgi:hypothetical protein
VTRPTPGQPADASLATVHAAPATLSDRAAGWNEPAASSRVGGALPVVRATVYAHGVESVSGQKITDAAASDA